jgi:hypothetical protein
VLYNLEYTSAAAAREGGLGLMASQWAKWTMRNPFLWFTGMAGGIAVAFRSRKRPEAAVWLLWLAAAFIAIAANRRYFHYYFIQITPPLAMLSAYLLDFGLTAKGKRILRVLIVPALAGCLVLLALDIQKVRQNLRPDLDFAFGTTTEDEYYARFVTGDFSFLADRYLADYLRDRTGPDEAIHIFGFEPLVYFLSDRRPAGRYIYNDPVTAAYAAGEVREARLDELLSDLRSKNAVYLVIVEGDANPVDPTDSFRFFMNTPALRNLVQTRYTLERRAGKFHIYRRIPR